LGRGGVARQHLQQVLRRFDGQDHLGESGDRRADGQLGRIIPITRRRETPHPVGSEVEVGVSFLKREGDGRCPPLSIAYIRKTTTIEVVVTTTTTTTRATIHLLVDVSSSKSIHVGVIPRPVVYEVEAEAAGEYRFSGGGGDSGVELGGEGDGGELLSFG